MSAIAPRECIVSYAPGTEPKCDISGSITEIVRCGACAYMHDEGCDGYGHCERFDRTVHCSCFCAWGARSDGR